MVGCFEPLPKCKTYVCFEKNDDDDDDEMPDLFSDVAAMSVKRHHSSAGDFIAINNHVVTACRSTTPLRLRPSRPKSEGNLSVQSLRAKRTSSFGVNYNFCRSYFTNTHSCFIRCTIFLRRYKNHVYQILFIIIT